MCGIAGFIGEGIQEAEAVVSRMLGSIRHRGPDSSAVYKTDSYGAFGHNRLSIIDLDAGANQPFVSNDGRYVLVFNGEIYNYRELKSLLSHIYNFKTNSDTEVLLAAYMIWGDKCLDRFIGMFSFAVWDKKENLFFAARDRFGVKPFFYTVQNGRMLFASEIKALWAGGVAKNKNFSVWSSYFVYGSYGSPEETFWKHINQLPGGHSLMWEPTKPIKIKKWYGFEDQVRSNIDQWRYASEQQISTSYFALLKESLAFRFRADVPVGFNVSGGLDSSLLLSLIKEAFPQQEAINAFSFYTGNPDYDELPWVKELIATTQYPLHPVLLSCHDVPALAERVAYHQDEPYGGIPTLAYSRIFECARKLGTIVLLDGQGIDEAWAGYDYYRTRNDQTVQGISGSPVRGDVLEEDFKSMAVKPIYPELFESKLLNLQYRDLFYTKIPRALRFNDRVSMMHSTELREPFLDHRLVEFAFALPERLKVFNNTGKFLLRQIVGSLLPEAIRLAPKRPLQTPQREWLQGDLREWVNDKIQLLREQPHIKKTELDKEWSNYLKGSSDNSFYVWQWMSDALLK